MKNFKDYEIGEFVDTIDKCILNTYSLQKSNLSYTDKAKIIVAETHDIGTNDIKLLEQSKTFISFQFINQEVFNKYLKNNI